MAAFARLCVCCSFTLCLVPVTVFAEVMGPQTLDSPNGQLRVTIQLDAQGQAHFIVSKLDGQLIKGTLGLAFADSGLLAENLQIIGTRRESRDETYAIPVSKISAKSLIGVPMLVEYAIDSKSRWIALTEANLTNYAGMYVSAVDGAPGTFAAKLSPLPGRDDGGKVVGEAPFASPWRVLMIADDPGRLIESNIVFHLNQPSKIEDPSWIRPGKTTFPWWNHYVLDGVDFEPGMNTATMKYYIDFCAEQGIPYHSLDGLDIAWYGGPIEPHGPTDVTTAAPSIDMPEVLRYAKEKGVRLRLWAHWKALKPQLDQTLATYETWGIEGVMIDFMDRDDQQMVRWYHEVAEKAARHHLTVTWHGAYKPTGMVDHPTAYRGQSGLDFLVDVPTTWDATRVLHVEMGKCLVIARRRGADWHLGGMTAGESRTLDLPMHVIGSGSFVAALYLDDEAAGPTSLTRHKHAVSSTDSLRIVMPPSGGFVAHMMKLPP